METLTFEDYSVQEEYYMLRRGDIIQLVTSKNIKTGKPQFTPAFMNKDPILDYYKHCQGNYSRNSVRWYIEDEKKIIKDGERWYVKIISIGIMEGLTKDGRKRILIYVRPLRKV